MEETPKDKVSNVEEYAVLKDFEDVFKEIRELSLEKDIYFFINQILRETPVSNNP
jgi:hypothetical protein